MSALPDGAFITSIDGRQCTAIPRNINNVGDARSTQPAQEPPAAAPTSTVIDSAEPLITNPSEPDPVEEAPANDAPTDEAPVDTAPIVTEVPSPSPPPPPPANSAPANPAPTTNFVVAPSAEPTAPPVASGVVEPEAPTIGSALPADANPEAFPTPTEEEVEETAPTVTSAADDDEEDPTLVVAPTNIADVVNNSDIPNSILPPSGEPTAAPSDDSRISPPFDEEATSSLVRDGDLVPTTVSGGVAPTGGLDSGGDSGRTFPGDEMDLPNNGVVDGSSSGNGMASSATIAGAVLGALAALALVGFLIWFWRRRNQKKRRQDGGSGPFSFAEKNRRPYEFDSDSVGPTPRSAKMKAAIGSNLESIGSVFAWPFRSRERGIALGEGSPRYLSPVRSAEPGVALPSDAKLSAKDKYLGWWSRLRGDDWRLRNGDRSSEAQFAAASMRERDLNATPDFNTLVGMNGYPGQHRRGRSSASAHSTDQFLSGLSYDLDHAERGADPFADVNAVPAVDAARPAPAPAPNNPFSDASAIRAPPTVWKPSDNYVDGVRRSRGSSITSRSSRAQSVHSIARTSYQESRHSLDAFEQRRDKFRSDPFDLELDARLAPRVSRCSSEWPQGGIGRAMSHSSRGESPDRALRYSTVSSLSNSSEWGGPGPDVGRSAGKGNQSRSSKAGVSIGMAM